MSQIATSSTRRIYRHDGTLGSIILPRPSNMHAHLRTGALRQAIATETMRPWKHLVVMPNTGPITTIEEMRSYRQELLRIRDEAGFKTNLIMTLYLTEKLTPSVVEKMAELPYTCAVKYYPPHKGATTGSGLGIPLHAANETLRAMETNGVRLCGHFESVFDKDGNELPHELREGYFMNHEFAALRERFPDLDITIEHATTKEAVRWVKSDDSGKTICGITPQALLLVREDLNCLTWGVHAKCMPIAKMPEDRAAVLELALSGDLRAHAGDDTAAHASKSKLVSFESAASGCYLPHSLALYAMIFRKHGKLEQLGNFTSFNGPDSWGLPRPDTNDTVELRCVETGLPTPVAIPDSNDVVIPFGWTNESDALHPGFELV